MTMVEHHKCIHESVEKLVMIHDGVSRCPDELIETVFNKLFVLLS